MALQRSLSVAVRTNGLVGSSATNDIGIRNRLHHPSLGTFHTHFSQALLGRRIAFCRFLLVLHFLLRHTQATIVLPPLVDQINYSNNQHNG